MSDKSFEVVDEETGIKLVYFYKESCGWSFLASGYADRQTRRQAVKLSSKYWPEQSEEHKKVEQEMLDVIRGLDLSEEK